MSRLSVKQHLGRVGLGATAAFLLAGPLAMPALADGAAVSMTEPSAEHYAFTSGTISVPTGSTVTWTNRTDAPHTVTANGGAFGSGLLNQNQSFQFNFSTAGTYTYYCTVHPYMHGSIIVTAAAAPAAAAPAAPAAPAPAAAHQPAPPAPAPASTLPAATAPAPLTPSMSGRAPVSQIPARMPSTGGGGTAPAQGAAGVAMLALLAGLVAIRGRRHSS